MDVGSSAENATKNDLLAACDFISTLVDDYSLVKTECIRKSIVIALHQAIDILKNSISTSFGNQESDNLYASALGTALTENETTAKHNAVKKSRKSGTKTHRG